MGKYAEIVRKKEIMRKNNRKCGWHNSAPVTGQNSGVGHLLGSVGPDRRAGARPTVESEMNPEQAGPCNL